MAEQPDTAAIRAGYDNDEGWAFRTIPALCDALDAARAELATTNHATSMNWMHRAEAAEARIAAALQQGHCVACVHEALTGDTGGV